MGATQFQDSHDLLKNGLRLQKYLIVPEAQDAKSLRFNQTVALLIVPDVLRVLSSIELDDDLRFEARKVGDEPGNRHLSPEPVAGELFGAQMLPKVALSIGRLVAQPTRSGL